MQRFQLITDIDDTIHPSGNGLLRGIAGIDNRLPNNVLYPCVKELHKAMYDKYRTNTVIVSANPFRPDPKKYKDLLRVPVVVYGGGLSSLNSLKGIGGIIHGPRIYDTMADEKIKSIRKHKRTHLTSKLIWIGDNGHGDVRVAQELLRTGDIELAFIHIVNPRRLRRPMNNLIYFQHYGQVLDVLIRSGILDERVGAACRNKNFDYARFL